MEPFTCTLANGATVAGISSIPPPGVNGPKSRPLVVGIHGGGYNSDYFHADARRTASIPSKAYGVPFVAIDRPCYGGTSAFDPMPDATQFPEETGLWLHKYILPDLWKKFGDGCSCIVLLCHSLGCQGGIIAAALHAQDDKPAYPLGGLITSGLGHRNTPIVEQAPKMQANTGEHYNTTPVEFKDTAMFSPGTVDPEILKQSERLNHPIPVAEANSTRAGWGAWRERWAAHVAVPVMYALVELDFFFVGSREHLQECVDAFGRSPRAEGSFIASAPHCLELSYWSHGWYARCFGFAMECANSCSVQADK